VSDPSRRAGDRRLAAIGERCRVALCAADGLHSSLAADLRLVLIDPGRLEQILVDLAVNARDAMPDRGALTVDTVSVNIDEDYAAWLSGCWWSDLRCCSCRVLPSRSSIPAGIWTPVGPYREALFRARAARRR
jgi:hypothetical protein